MTAKIKNIIIELLELEEEINDRYSHGDVDVVFSKGSVIETRHALEQLLHIEGD